MKRLLLVALVCTSVHNSYAWAETKRYEVTAMILKIDRPHLTFVASSEAIPGYMEAMVMPFTVRDPKLLEGLAPGTMVDFSLVVEADDSFAEKIRVRKFESLEQDPLQARRLQVFEHLNQAATPSSTLSLGQPVPDFTLTDQRGRRVSLSHFLGKVVGVSFMYTSCPLPNYCFRLSNNFGRLQKRFADRMGRDLELLTISFDPAHDVPEVLAKYASIWNADADSWHFLTGTPPEIKTVCGLFGVNSYPDEGTMTHSLHTVVINRQGRLAANFEGNQFTAQQLGDFMETVLPSR